MYPLAVSRGNDALGTEDHTVGIVLNEGVKRSGDLFCREFSSRFYAKALKHVVGVMVSVIVAAAAAMLVVVVVVLVIVAMALLAVVMMVLVIVAVALLAVVVLVLVIVAVALLAIVMVVLVIVAVALLAVVVVVLVIVAMALLTVVMMVLVIVAVALLSVVVVMVVMVLLLEVADSLLESVSVLYRVEDLLARELIPGCGDYCGCGVILSDEGCCVLDASLLCRIGMREDNGGCVADLIAEELAEVLHIHLALACIDYGGKASELILGALYALHRLDNVGELTDARGLDEDSVGVVLGKDLGKCLREIADERAAYAARVHLGDLDARVLEEAAVNADLAELVLDEDELLACVSLLDKLFDQSGLSRSEKARKNVNFRHNIFSVISIFLFYVVTLGHTSPSKFQLRSTS